MIRRRLVALILLVVAGVTGVGGVLIVTGIERRLVDGVDRELVSRRDVVAPTPGHEGRRPPGPRDGDPNGGGGGGADEGGGADADGDPSPFDVRRYAFVDLDRDGTIINTVTSGPGDDPDPPPDVTGLQAADGPRTVASVEGEPRYRVVVIPQGDGGAVVAGIPLTDVEEAVRAARDIVVVAGVLAVALAGLIVWFMVRRSLRPIDQMIVSAERIAAGELSERTPVPQPASEVGHLGTALNVMLDRIEEAVDAKTASEARTRRFAADASHELRTPLTSIRGYAELYRQGARSPEEVARAMGRIEHEAVRMGDLVGDLLLLARLDQGRPLERDDVDLTALVLDAVAAAKAVEPDRRVQVDVGEEPVTVSGDPHRLRQVVDNLLANVRDHTPPATAVAVRLGVTPSRSQATLVVADDGPGMAPEDAAHAFDRFWQAEGDSSASRGQRGTGLGLSIVAEIVAAHGGDIRLDTAPGAGASFTIVLPIRG
ncbi:MAG: two-component system, OmpR family, sensor kinase [Actinomycetota bacterium]|nr:two-component system, OmpR family, sensor kinase [Actinomycetota bacterium]